MNGYARCPSGRRPRARRRRSGKTLVVCHEEHRFIVREQLEDSGGAPPTILLEPVARDTAPALTSAALWASRRGGDPVLLVCPSDHVVSDLPAFHRTVSAALRFGNEGMIVAFGVSPTLPETGYGYIRRGGRVRGEGTTPTATPSTPSSRSRTGKRPLPISPRAAISGTPASSSCAPRCGSKR